MAFKFRTELKLSEDVKLNLKVACVEFNLFKGRAFTFFPLCSERTSDLELTHIVHQQDGAYVRYLLVLYTVSKSS